jgi:hypothetical protein
MTDKQKHSPLADIIKERNELALEKKNILESTAKRTSEIDVRLTELTQREVATLNGLDMSRIDSAKKFIAIRGWLSKGHKTKFYSDSREAAVENAKTDLIAGCKRMRSEYFGVKNYDGFGDQGHNASYGMGPRHGSIVFSIGLTSEGRTTELTVDNIEDCLYYLSVLAKYEEALKLAGGK